MVYKPGRIVSSEDLEKRNKTLSEKYKDYNPNRRYYVNDYLFDSWTPTSAYLYGVLFADGHVSSSKERNRVQISLSIKDQEWLTELMSYFEFDGPLKTGSINDKYKPRQYVTFGFSSKRIKKRLLELGIKNDVPKLDKELFRHFARGFFDGDGSVYHSSGTPSDKLRVNFANKKAVLETVRDLFHEYINTSSTVKASQKSNSPSCYSICYADKDSRKIYDYFYKNTTMYLLRKKSRFEEIMNSKGD